MLINTSFKKKVLLIIAGPTAVGKTKLSIELAQYFNSEILSVDSRQIYEELNIGVARPDPKELRIVPHHFIGNKSIHTPYSAGDFEKESLSVLNTLFEKHNLIVVVGGTGLYIKALTDGLDTFPAVSDALREDLNVLHKTKGLEILLDELKEKDPEYFEVVDRKNPRRVIRALEIIRTTGSKFSSMRQGLPAKRPFSAIKLGLTEERATLYDKINRRVDQMILQGLIEEAKTLLPYRKLSALQTVGYSEIFSYLEGEISKDEAIELIKKNTRNYAKRQLTWFKKDKGFEWFTPNQLTPIIHYVKAQLKL